MGAYSKKTPEKLQRMRALHARKLSAREIAEDLGISSATALDWLAGMGLAAHGKSGPRRYSPAANQTPAATAGDRSTAELAKLRPSTARPTPERVVAATNQTSEQTPEQIAADEGSDVDVVLCEFNRAAFARIAAEAAALERVLEAPATVAATRAAAGPRCATCGACLPDARASA